MYLAPLPTPQPLPVDAFPEIGWLRLGFLAILIVLAWEALKALVPQAVTAVLGSARRWASSRAGKAAQERALRGFTKETLGTNWLSCLPSVSKFVGDAPLEEIYQPLALSFSYRGKQLSSASLAEVLSSARSFAIVGTPGCGKSTLLSMVALSYARGSVEDELHLKESRLPIFLALARLPVELGALPDLAAAALGRAGCKVEVAFLRDQLKSGRCVLLLDGLDEAVAPSRQAQLARWIHDSISAFPGNRFLVTCRTTEWNSMRVPGLPEARILPLDINQREHLVERWTRLMISRGFEPTHVIAARSSILKSILADSQDSRLTTIVTNPFLLTIMTVLHLSGVAIPDRRSSLYNALVRTLLGEWDLVKGVRASSLTPDAIAERVEFFQKVALYLAKKPELQDRIDLADRELSGLLDNTAEELIGQGGRVSLLMAEARGTGLLTEEEPRVFAFSNRGILEFLAARELAHRRDNRTAVLHIGESAWHEILLQFIEQTTELEIFLRLLAESLVPHRGPFSQLLAHAILEARTRGISTPQEQQMLREHLLESARQDDLSRDIARVSWRALGEPWQKQVAKAATGESEDIISIPAAVRLLAFEGGSHSITSLRQALTTAPPEMEKLAAEALQETSSPEATDLLWELAARKESGRAAIKALSSRGEAILSSARAALANGTPFSGSTAEKRSLAAIEVLAGIQSSVALSVLLEFAGRCSPPLHLGVIAALHEKQLARGGLDEARRIVDEVLGKPTLYMRYGKRAFDMLLSSTALVLSLPMLALAAVCVWLDSPGPVLFRQVRIGRAGRNFYILRFRTLRYAEESAKLWALEGDPRVTRVGHFLRLTRLDELPGLFNVLQGDMSFVGPRAERSSFSDYLLSQIPYYGRRMNLAPGLTGLAQLHLPYAASFEESSTRLAWDLYYVARCSFWLDLTILARTAILVLIGRGALR